MGFVTENKIKKKRPLLYYIAVASFLFLFEVSVLPENAVNTSGDAYVSAGIAEARILIPFLSTDSASSSICSLIYNGLIKVDKDLNVAGDLAKAWEISEDGLVITVYLKKGVKWHDGHSFSAEDVEFTFETILDPGNGCPYISGYTDISDINIIDPNTVQFIYSRPYVPALLRLSMGIIPKHIFKNIKDIKNSLYAREPIGTGPYIFKKWESSRYILLEANQEYFEHVPGLKYYVHRITPDKTVQFLELVSGGIDSMELNPYQYIYRSITKEFTSQVQKYKFLDHLYVYLGYNLQDPLFKDKRVRQAIGYAINRKEIISSVLLGLGEICTGPFLKGTPYYDETVPGYGYDTKKARHLLHEAGWIDNDADGVLEKDGQEFRFRIVTNQGNQVREDAAQIIQSQLSELGIKVEIQVIAWAAFLDQFINKKKFQAVMLGWTLPVDPDCYSVWHSESIDNGGLNFISYANSEVDALIEDGRSEFDVINRAEIYKKIHRIIAEESPYTFLFFPYAMPAVQKRIKGIKPAPAGISYNFIDWYVPEDEVRYKF